MMLIFSVQGKYSMVVPHTKSILSFQIEKDSIIPINYQKSIIIQQSSSSMSINPRLRKSSTVQRRITKILQEDIAKYGRRKRKQVITKSSCLKACGMFFYVNTCICTYTYIYIDNTYVCVNEWNRHICIQEHNIGKLLIRNGTNSAPTNLQ